MGWSGIEDVLDSTLLFAVLIQLRWHPPRLIAVEGNVPPGPTLNLHGLGGWVERSERRDVGIVGATHRPVVVAAEVAVPKLGLVAYRSSHARHYDASRYHWLNLHSFFQEGGQEGQSARPPPAGRTVSSGCYRKELVRIPLNGKTVEAMAYVMDENRPRGIPEEWYYNVIEDAYAEFGFDASILECALDESTGYCSRQK